MDSFSTTFIPAGSSPTHVAVAPDGSGVYATHWFSPTEDFSKMLRKRSPDGNVQPAARRSRAKGGRAQ